MPSIVECEIKSARAIEYRLPKSVAIKSWHAFYKAACTSGKRKREASFLQFRRDLYNLEGVQDVIFGANETTATICVVLKAGVPTSEGYPGATVLIDRHFGYALQTATNHLT